MGIFRDIKNSGANRKKAESLQREIDDLKTQMTPEMLDAALASQRIRELNTQIEVLERTVDSRNQRVEELDGEIKERKKRIVTFDDAILAQEFGLYEPRFDFANSSQFKEKLQDTRNRQKELVKSFNASLKKTTWTVNSSKAEGKKMVGDIGRLLMRAFNGECDEVVAKVKYANIDRSLDAIDKSYEAVNKYGRVLGISIPEEYRKLKRREVLLAFEYAQKKEEEKEALRAERERQREEAKLQKEIAETRKRLEKERKQYQSAYNDVLQRLKVAEGQERVDLAEKEAELRAKLHDVEAAVEDVDYREANQRAGFVYIISNIGSFGPDVYKIGMTRRLDPMERIRELGDASVPFSFDVHALMFCDDAPKLEAALHRAFENRKLNMVNHRREFFRVSLNEIEEVILKNYDKTVEFIETPDAEQYRISEQMRRHDASRAN